MLKVFYLHTLFDADIAYASTAKRYEMSTAFKGLSDVASQCSDVGAFAANDAKCELHLIRVEVDKFQFVDDQNLRFQIYLFAFSSQFIGAMSIYFASRECRWNLFYAPYKSREDLLNQLQCDVVGRIGLVNRFFEVEAGRCGSKLQGGNIFFRTSLQFIDLLCGPSCANNASNSDVRLFLSLIRVRVWVPRACLLSIIFGMDLVL